MKTTLSPTRSLRTPTSLEGRSPLEINCDRLFPSPLTLELLPRSTKNIGV
ncbi:hypothetical protein K9N68_16330 [Kovacikia minuta CCNUW1]|nr:hypothetical protein [Kovacikia minuta]UBF29257.1 hypothetical protein K9N68_16330 [Kovacikia minuta CCNUW1]